MRNLLIAIMMLVASNMFAQDTPKPITPIKIQLGLGGNYSVGNANVFGFTSNNFVSYTSLRREWSMTPSFIYTQVQQDNEFKTKQRELYITGSVQQRRNRDKIFSSFEIENSLVKQIRLRSSIGLGWSFDILRTDKTKLIISEAAVYESYLSDILINKNLQSIRASTRIRFTNTNRINTDIVALIQPAIWDDRELKIQDNINMRIVATFAIPINKKIQFGLTSTLNGSTYSTYVNPSVKPIDVVTSFSIIYKNL